MKSVDPITRNALAARSNAGLRALSRDELAFLPAALEIVETPPSPIGRAIAGTIILLFCVALVWATFGRVDIVASATGKVVPSGHSKIIQPFETGVVRAIHVQDGQSVKAGDPLVELDATLNQADRNHLVSDLTATRLDIARLKAALEGNTDFQPPEGADPTLVDAERQLLTNQTAEHGAKIAALDRQEAQKDAERKTAAATVEKYRAFIPLQEEKAEIYRQLYEKGYASKVQFLDTSHDLVESKKELAVAQSQYREAEQALAGIVQTRNQGVAEYRRQLSDQLATAEEKAAGTAQDLTKAEQRTRLQLLTAPVDGVVQQLAVHTIGGVVTPAQNLLVVVPREADLEIEATVANRDIGFVFPGQDVEIKIDAFDFTRYGLIHGRVLSVSQDAIIQAPSGDSRTDSATVAPKDQELNYSVRIALDRSNMHVDDRLIDLSPGMTAKAEIKTGSRRIIDFFLSPILRVSQGSLKER